MSESYVLRPAIHSDAVSLTRLFMDYNAEYDVPTDESAVLRKTTDLLSKCLSERTHSVYTATFEDSVVGFTVVHWIPFMWLHGMEGYISEMLVQANHRGRGVGNQLLARVEDEARELGCFRLMLNNFHVQESYKREFYAKNGFTERHGVGSFVKELVKG